MKSFVQKTLSVGPLACNCQVLVCPETLEAIIVDPGADPEKILRTIVAIEKEKNARIKVKALFHTHAHFDHIAGTRGVKEGLLSLGDVPQIFLHPEDHFIYQMLKAQGAMFGMSMSDPLPVDQFFQDNQEFKFGKLKFTVLHTPGHSPGGVCFRMHSDSEHQIPETVFTGDSLFKEGIGRTDLWGADGPTLIKSIKQRLLTLDQDTIAWPGHGEVTTIGHEKEFNPYL